MEYLDEFDLLDPSGKPLSTRITRVLRQLRRRFQRQFPAIQDDVAQVQVFEEAGRRIAQREQRDGPIEKLYGYAWVTVRSVAQSSLRRGSSRLIQHTLDSDTADTVLAALLADSTTPEQIERGILVRELEDRLSREERVVWLYKLRGYSSREIAAHQRSTVRAVNTFFWRAKRKIRAAIGVQPVERRLSDPTTVPTTTSLRDTEDATAAHGEPPPRHQTATHRR